MTARKQPAGVLAGFLLILASSAAATAGDGPRWHGDLAAAQAEAKRTARPIFAVFR